MKYLNIVCLFSSISWLVQAGEITELGGLNSQLLSLSHVVKHEDPSSKKSPTCARSVLGLDTSDYDFLLIDARYEPFKKFIDDDPLSFLQDVLESAFDITLKEGESLGAHLTDGIYQEFYYLTRNKKKQLRMQQIVIFACDIHDIYNDSLVALAKYQFSLHPQFTDEQELNFLKNSAQALGISEDEIPNWKKIVKDARLNEEYLHSTNPDFQTKDALEENRKLDKASPQARRQIIEEMKTESSNAMYIHFLGYLIDWVAFKKSNATLAQTIDKVAHQRGMNIQNNFVVLSRMAYLDQDIPNKVGFRSSVVMNQIIKGATEFRLPYVAELYITLSIFGTWEQDLSLERITSMLFVPVDYNKKNLNIMIDSNISQDTLYTIIKTRSKLTNYIKGECLVATLDPKALKTGIWNQIK